MKKLITLSIFIAIASFSNCNISKLIEARSNGDTKFSLSLDKTTNYKIQKIDELFTDVLKTDKQLIPKYCNYLVISGVKKEETTDAKKAIQVAVLANSTTTDSVLYVYLNKNQEAFEELKAFLEKEIKVIAYSTENELINKIYEKKENHDSLDYRRILLLTSSKNMRIYYSKLINVLGENSQNMIIDNFAYLYKTTREEYEHPSIEEVKEAYSQINCN